MKAFALLLSTALALGALTALPAQAIDHGPGTVLNSTDVAVASTPLQVLSISGGAGTFSLDPHDIRPERSIFGVYETDRFVSPNEIAIITDVLTNAKATGARFLQRRSNRGTCIVLIEVKAIPVNQGSAAVAGFEVRLGGGFAGAITTNTPVSTTFPNLLFYAESDLIVPGPSTLLGGYPMGLRAAGTFSVVYPIGMTPQIRMNTWDPFTQADWQPQIPLSPVSFMDANLYPNMRAHYDVSAYPGLINASGSLDGTSNWAHDCFLNLTVKKNEWIALPITPLP